jgi:hypothetical protein
MSTLNSSARNRRTDFNDNNEAGVELVILYIYCQLSSLGFPIPSHLSGQLSTACICVVPIQTMLAIDPVRLCSAGCASYNTAVEVGFRRECTQADEKQAKFYLFSAKPWFQTPFATSCLFRWLTIPGSKSP